MMLALDEGYEGFGWKVFGVGPHAQRRAEGEPREIAARLLQRSGGADQRRRADVLHDQRDHEPLRAVAPGRQLLGHRHRALRRLLALSRGDHAGRIDSSTSCGSTRNRCRRTRSHDAAGRPGDGPRQRRRRQRLREPSQRRRVVPPRVAGGARRRRAEGQPARERPVKTMDVAPTVARILGFKMAECEGKPLVELPFQRSDRCNSPTD